MTVVEETLAGCSDVQPVTLAALMVLDAAVDLRKVAGDWMNAFGVCIGVLADCREVRVE